MDEDVLPWTSLLLVFEGTAVTIRRPRTEFQGDLDFNVSQPVFITSAAPLCHPVPLEQSMMDRRFRFFHFGESVPPKQVVKAPPCAACFASLVVSLTAPPPNTIKVSFTEGFRDTTCCFGDPHPSQSSSCSSSSSSSCSSSSCCHPSISSTKQPLPFCGDCGMAVSSSQFCGVSGKKHLCVIISPHTP